MMKRIGAIMLMGIMALSVGCFNVNYVTNKPAGETIEGTHHFYLSGLVGTEKVDARRLCPSGMAKLRINQTIVDSLISGLTLGIYTPQTYRITCAKHGGGQ